MTRHDRLVDGPESAPDGTTDSTFLGGIEFLTGPGATLGSFLLVVGIVTCVFIALFQFALPDPVSNLLTAGVVFVTVLTAGFAAALERVGYFGRETPANATSGERRPAAKPWVPTERPSAPLPPIINFDAELRAFADMFDGTLPPAFDPFIEDYRRLKTNTENRATIASDLRADLNPIGTLFEVGSEGDRLYEELSDRLFRYVSTRNHLRLDRVAFYDDTGTETAVTALADRLGSVEFEITNDGEAADVAAVVTLLDATGSAIASRSCDAGRINPGATTALTTDIFVPADAVDASTRLRLSAPSGTTTDA
ncbi:hypothetical protein [Haloarcula onubensis]|uniref:Uncharacterized protein n=1 Tax=Haloarcula onubensis TaxID=2950539 RepID=A0ABU2FPE3_9EURY|nr:hypothetical protein [Halomicroarcula sp. S3CR25-11]MDS0282628.1 hypothetical protein [Halomicroarcula sp. S3CR25-11]